MHISTLSIYADEHNYAKLFIYTSICIFAYIMYFCICICICVYIYIHAYICALQFNIHTDTSTKYEYTNESRSPSSTLLRLFWGFLVAVRIVGKVALSVLRCY